MMKSLVHVYKKEQKMQDVEIPNLEEQFSQEPEAISKITRV